MEQREKLERTEKNLDEIHRTTQLTQRSLNSLKSVFGGFFKNKFSKAPSATSIEKMVNLTLHLRFEKEFKQKVVITFDFCFMFFPT